MKTDELNPSKSGQFLVELKQHKAGLWSTVTYKKDGRGMLPFKVDRDVSIESIQKFLDEN